ncbi:hypothetical protein IFR05_005876 [Cadophora sp. M221]|nr:hypothetical protein IFR05_005876 [Cadophora sp. M221]
MEEVIQNLLRRVIGEVLIPCGLSNKNDELLNDGIAHVSRIGKPTRPMLYFIANPITVNQIRLDARIKRDLKSEDLVFVRVRKSNRLKSSTQKRQFDNLEGLTSPCKRKRKSRSTNKPIKKPATIDESSADMDMDVGTSSGANEPATNATAEDAAVVTPAAVNEHGTDAAPEDALVDTPAAVNEHGTDAAPEDALVDTPAAVNGHGTDAAPEDAVVDTPAAVNEHGTDAAAEDALVDTPAAVNGHGTDAAAEDTTVGTPSGQTDNSSAQSSSTTENTQIGAQPNPVLSCPLPTIADLLHPEHAIRIATSVLSYLSCSSCHVLSSPS